MSDERLSTTGSGSPSFSLTTRPPRSEALRAARYFFTGVRCSRPNLNITAHKGEQDHRRCVLAVGRRTGRENSNLTYLISRIVGAFAIVLNTKNGRRSRWRTGVGASLSDTAHDRAVGSDEAETVNVTVVDEPSLPVVVVVLSLYAAVGHHASVKGEGALRARRQLNHIGMPACRWSRFALQ